MLNFAIGLEKEYNEKFAAIDIVNVVKDMIGFDRRTGMSA